MKKCPITNKGPQIGGGYSNETRATQFNPVGKRFRQPNMIKKKLYVPELGKHVKIEISAAGLRTIEKRGVYPTLKKAGLI